MSILQLPETPEEITAELLNAVLEPSVDWNGPQIVALEMQVLESPSGNAFRADLEFEDGRHDSVFLKMHNASVLAVARMDYYGEVYFYREVASKSGVPTPKTYFAEWDEVNARQLIIQEFLTGGSIGTAETLLEQRDQERILSVLAEMHARWWNSPELEQLTGIRTGEQAMESGRKQFQSGKLDGRKFLERFGDHVHPKIAELYRTVYTGDIGTRLRNGFSPNITLCHYDISAKNIFLPDDLQKRTVLFDWGLVVRGYVGVELAQFLATTTDPAEHDRLSDLLRFYHSALSAGGIADYSFDTLWQDFRYGCLVRLAAPIALASRNNPRADALALTILPLISATVLSVDAIELLK